MEEWKKLKVIREWRDAAEGENSYFAKFALEYFAFNSLLRLIFSESNKETDRDLIERFKGWVIGKNIDFSENTLIGELIKIIEKQPLKNLTRDKEITISCEKDWYNIIEAVYVIRNNLFHGHKEYSRERDEKLVKVGYGILSKFNEILIDEFKEKYNIQEENS